MLKLLELYTMKMSILLYINYFKNLSLSYILKKKLLKALESDFHLNFAIGNSLAVQWLALCALTAKGLIREFRSFKPLSETKKKKKGYWAS